MDRTWFKIGYIAKTHGLKGGVTIILNDDSPDLHEIETIFVESDKNLIPYVVREFSDRSDKAFVQFEGVTTQDQADKMRGCSLFLPTEERTQLARGEFYDDEVIGFEVVAIEAGRLGTIREVLQMGPNRLLAVSGSEKEILIPVNGPFIRSINKSKKLITVDLPEGFLDI